MGLIRYSVSGDEVVAAAPASALDDGGDYWAASFACGALRAIAAGTAVVLASGTAYAGAVADQDQAEIVSNVSMLEEADGPVLPPPLPLRFAGLYLPDADDVPAGFLRGQPDEDFYTPPAQWPSKNLALYLPDATDITVTAAAPAFGDEDYDVRALLVVQPVPRIAPAFAAEDEYPPSLGLDEDLDPRPLLARQVAVVLQPQAFTVDEDFVAASAPSLTAAEEYDYRVPFVVQTTQRISPAFVSDDEYPPSLTVDEDVPPPPFRVQGANKVSSAFSADDEYAPAITVDEDYAVWPLTGACAGSSPPVRLPFCGDDDLPAPAVPLGVDEQYDPRDLLRIQPVRVLPVVAATDDDLFLSGIPTVVSRLAPTIVATMRKVHSVATRREPDPVATKRDPTKIKGG